MSWFGTIEVHVEPEWYREEVAIWIHTKPSEAGYDYLMGDLQTWTRIERGAMKPEPTMRLHASVVAPLLAALSEFDPPDKAVTNHLKDAMLVRDRLLSLVEAQANAGAVAPIEEDSGLSGE